MRTRRTQIFCEIHLIQDTYYTESVSFPFLLFLFRLFFLDILTPLICFFAFSLSECHHRDQG